jgi:hypothetical protein
LRDERRARMAVIQSRSEALTGIIGARRAWTVSMISPLSMPGGRRGDAEVAVPELTLDDDHRDAFAGHLDGVGVPELMWCEATPHSCRAGGAPQLGTCRSRRPVPSARRAVDDVSLPTPSSGQGRSATSIAPASMRQRPL